MSVWRIHMRAVIIAPINPSEERLGFILVMVRLRAIIRYRP